MRNKTTSGLLALFLGGFGFHRFYLGQCTTSKSQKSMSLLTFIVS